MAQIKSNRFRKNIQSFDIIKSIDAVINIQLEIALEKNINIFAEYVNIDSSNALIRSDEQRI